mgnify:CR=1 FL=1
MEIKPNGTQSSAQVPAECFTGKVWGVIAIWVFDNLRRL